MSDEGKLLKEAGTMKYDELNVIERMVRARENLNLKYGYMKARDMVMSYLGTNDIVKVIEYDNANGGRATGKLLAEASRKAG